MPAARACRDYGPRGDRQKTRLMWLVEAMGVGPFREKIGEYMGDVKLRTAVEEKVGHSHAIPARFWSAQLTSTLC